MASRLETRGLTIRAETIDLMRAGQWEREPATLVTSNYQNVTRAVNSRVHYRRLNDRLEGPDGGNRAPSWSPS